MEQKKSEEEPTAKPMDVEFLPLVLLHKIHRNLKCSQVDIVPIPYYSLETNDDEMEREIEGEEEEEAEVKAPQVIYAPPLPALKEKKNWWDFARPVYAFNNPEIRSRVEKLMGSHIVYVMDRKYMVRLQERIKEDHLNSLKKRIQQREAEEIEREKSLILEGKIPIEDAAKELRNHPVCRINQLAALIIESKHAKVKPTDKLAPYRTPAKRIRLVEKAKKEFGFENEPEEEDLGISTSAACVVDADADEDVSRGFMFTKEEFSKTRYEDELMKELREVEVVQDMYDLADKILGSVGMECRKF